LQIFLFIIKCAGNSIVVFIKYWNAVRNAVFIKYAVWDAAFSKYAAWNAVRNAAWDAVRNAVFIKYWKLAAKFMGPDDDAGIDYK